MMSFWPVLLALLSTSMAVRYSNWRGLLPHRFGSDPSPYGGGIADTSAPGDFVVLYLQNTFGIVGNQVTIFDQGYVAPGNKSSEPPVGNYDLPLNKPYLAVLWIASDSTNEMSYEYRHILRTDELTDDGISNGGNEVFLGITEDWLKPYAGDVIVDEALFVTWEHKNGTEVILSQLGLAHTSDNRSFAIFTYDSQGPLNIFHPDTTFGVVNGDFADFSSLYYAGFCPISEVDLRDMSNSNCGQPAQIIYGIDRNEKPESTHSKRTKKLTAKVMEQYKHRVSEFKGGLCAIKEKIIQTITSNESVLDEISFSRLLELGVSINAQYERYNRLYSEFMLFLSRTCTAESNIESVEQSIEERQFKVKVDSFLLKAYRLREEKGQVPQTGYARTIKSRSSVSRSRTSSGSLHSSMSRSTLARKQAKAEAAKAQMAFLEKEAEIRRQQSFLQEKESIATATRAREHADLETELKLIQEKKHVAAVTAEADALELSFAGSHHSMASFESLPRSDPLVRTAEFVTSQAPEIHFKQTVPALTPEVVAPSTAVRGNTSEHLHPPFGDHKKSPDRPSLNPTATVFTPPIVDPLTVHAQTTENPVGSLQPSLEKSQNNHQQPSFKLPYPQTEEKGNNIANDLTRFLLRKDLAMSRLSKFNDRADNFQAWKASFSDVMSDIGVSPSEEVDLLVKWLGPESQKHAISLRSAYSKDYSKGLAKIWERLDERFGAAESVHHSIVSKLEKFPKISTRESGKLYELSDILAEIQALKQDPKYAVALSYFDSSVGVSPIIGKVSFLQERWARRATDYKRARDVAFPPFCVLADFISDQAKLRNDPGLQLHTTQVQTERKEIGRKQVFSRKTEIKKPFNENVARRCPIHKTEHSLDACRVFQSKTFAEKRDFVKQNDLCFKCLSPEHRANDCTRQVKCDICTSHGHCSVMHRHGEVKKVGAKQGGEKSSTIQSFKQENQQAESITNKCTALCGKEFAGRSCAKTILVNVFPSGHPEKSVLVYAVHDEQSNKTLGNTSLFDNLDLIGDVRRYTLNSCSGTTTINARHVTDIIVQSVDGTRSIEIRDLIECDIPCDKSEIPTPDVARNYPHLKPIVEKIPDLMDSAEIGLLIGRDVLEAHHIEHQILGPRELPFAQRLPLGWVIVGEVCLGKFHRPSNSVNVRKTHLMNNGRPSLFEPCPNELRVTDHVGKFVDTDDDIFTKTKNDEKIGLSMEDREFLTLMDQEMYKSREGNWVAPLPFRSSRPHLPNNKPQAVKRAQLLDKNLKRDDRKKKHFVDFMKDVIENGHAEVAPPLGVSEECWYLPIFGIYHPKKPDQLRGVFDASAKYQGISLNDVLMNGPDLINSLLGVLIRFRKEQVAITADIQRMFYCFFVTEKHRNFLRFLWYRNNDPDQELIEYRMCVHVFGNKPSPAVATFGLRRTAEESAEEFGEDVRDFVCKNFYVDDGLASMPTDESATDLMKRTQAALKNNGSLRLHKIASNSDAVMKAFPVDDLAKDLRSLDLSSEELPLQRSLGLHWSLTTDTFLFQVSKEKKPFTKRGVLSTINSIYDPIGMVSPIVVTGKLLLRELMSEKSDWDQPLPSHLESRWENWRISLDKLEGITVPRAYFPVSLSLSVNKKLQIYSDASEKAIAAAVYILAQSKEGGWYKSLVMGKAKVAPKSGHTIPRLELCAAVLAVELFEIATAQLQIEFQSTDVTFYTDSKVVLGYVQNQTRRFYTYVSNRVERIRRSSSPIQWTYIKTDENPADCATRPIQVTDFLKSPWLDGPVRLPKLNNEDGNCDYALVDPDEDKEIRPVVNTYRTEMKEATVFDVERFERFSAWSKLVGAISCLIHIGRSFSGRSKCSGWHTCAEAKTPAIQEEARLVVISAYQQKSFPDEKRTLIQKGHVSNDSPLSSLDPFIDTKGLIRVGGRLSRASLPSSEKNPIIIPKRSHMAILLIRHYHAQVQHQGRHITEGAIRADGYWIIGCKAIVSSVIQNCIKCKRLRGSRECQKMADLPVARLKPSPPFSFVGVDTFGPWEVLARKTRGGHANSKRWALMFTCLTIRAVHIEVIESLSASCFINAFRRFTAIRGEVKEVYSDCGTNFVGAANEMGTDTINVEDTLVKQFLTERRMVWKFNPPHASHMGGAWERMIGVTRRILDSMMLGMHQTLTHEILTTLMAEVSAIINARPLIPVSTDPSQPEILTPATLLTQKTSRSIDLEYLPVDLKTQWKQVQALADRFWKRWRVEYLQTLQNRRKWKCERTNLKVGDVVLIRDKEAHRNEWLMGLVINVFPGEDDNVRKVEVKTTREGKTSTYIRPVTELVLLLS